MRCELKGQCCLLRAVLRPRHHANTGCLNCSMWVIHMSAIRDVSMVVAFHLICIKFCDLRVCEALHRARAAGAGDGQRGNGFQIEIDDRIGELSKLGELVGLAWNRVVRAMTEVRGSLYDRSSESAKDLLTKP